MAPQSVPSAPGACGFASVACSSRLLSSAAASTSGACLEEREPVFTLAQAAPGTGRRRRDRPSLGTLLLSRRFVAAIALVPEPAILFTAGAVAGAFGKTLTAPLDRVKLLLQTRGGYAIGGLKEAAKRGSVLDSLVAIGRQEGIGGYWRGNVPQILKVIPYSATQLCAYELFKSLLGDGQGRVSVGGRLAAGAAAGMTATLVTYPLDTLRLRMAVDPSSRSLAGAARLLLREGSYQAFFRGLGASLVGIAPYMAMELCIFDCLPKELPPFVRGFSAALISTSVCYPLDTIRRHIQLQSAARLGAGAMARQLWAAEGAAGFYRGFIPSAVKNLPNKGIRLTVFDKAKRLLKASGEAYEEACLELQLEPV